MAGPLELQLWHWGHWNYSCDTGAAGMTAVTLELAVFCRPLELQL